ncbi:GTPase SAR1 [Pyrenophora teres f. maculata]|nr:GTPase SAR1 [Pyrenophora teres f. maculata]
MDYSPLPPEITVLLLGDAEVGKSTFLSRLSLGIQPSTSTTLPPYTLPKLRDQDQPHAFDITLYARPYRLQFYDTSSPTHYTLLHPHFVILCYDISRRPTLDSLYSTWLPIVNQHFAYNENLPVMVLGLKRDLRKQWTAEEHGIDGKGKGESVMPHEGLQTARTMLCDHYAECSAVTGELCREVLEDVAKTCAKTTTEAGGKSKGMDMCGIM